MKNIYATRKAARLYGIFFLTAFLSYGVGSAMIASIVDVPDFLSNVYTHRSQIVIGVILIALIHSFVNIGLAVVMVPVLKVHNKAVTYGYLSAAIAATVTLIVGAIFILLLIPLSSEFITMSSGDIPYFETMGSILKNGNYYAYQIGMALWGLGGLLFCYLLYISKLVPRPFVTWGFIGYIALIIGTQLELFGYPYGVMLSLPGGLFEVTLSIWLIVKGFSRSTASNHSNQPG